MTYIVQIQTGSKKKKNFTKSQSIPLSSKQKVRDWIRRNPIGNSNTKVIIKNTLDKKIIITTITTKSGASIFGLKCKKRI